MLKFFRQIRHKMLTENRTSKYLLYATGEILLVVIGILIAMQINNWNETRKDAIKEQKVLISLLEDFKYSQSRLKISLEAYPKEIKKLEVALNSIGVSLAELSDESRNNIYSTGYRATAIAEGSIQSVLNTEKLELIGNDSLKNLLTAYPSESNKFKSQEMRVRNITLNLHRSILESYVSLTDFISADKKRFPQLKEHAIPSDFIGLLKDKKYQNVLVDRMIQTKRLIRVAEEFLIRIDVIISLLEQEINKE